MLYFFDLLLTIFMCVGHKAFLLLLYIFFVDKHFLLTKIHCFPKNTTNLFFLKRILTFNLDFTGRHLRRLQTRSSSYLWILKSGSIIVFLLTNRFLKYFTKTRNFFEIFIFCKNF